MTAHLKFLPARENLFEDYYKLKCEKENIFWTGFKDKPEFEGLKNWYIKQLDNKDRLFFLVYSTKDMTGEICGYLYIDLLEKDRQKTADISYGVSENFAGKGIGTEIVKYAADYALNELKLPLVTAWVAVNNFASQKIVFRNGFQKSDDTKKTFFKSLNEEVLFEKYYKKGKELKSIKGMSGLEFKKASPETFEDYYLVKCQPSHIHWSGFKQKPDYERFKEWYLKKIETDGWFLYLAYTNDREKAELAGYITFEVQNGHAEIHNSGVSENHHGKGVGTALIAFAVEYVKNNYPEINKIDGWVSEANEFSYKMLLKNNFVKTGITEFRRIEALNNDILFAKIVHNIKR